jgi:hypothetical protein
MSPGQALNGVASHDCVLLRPRERGRSTGASCRAAMRTR